MNIFELVFDNQGQYEDYYVKSFYYETYKEARKAFDEFNANEEFMFVGAYLQINELELGTQKRTEVYKKVLFTQKPYKGGSRLVGGSVPFADIEAIENLRRKLAGIV